MCVYLLIISTQQINEGAWTSLLLRVECTVAKSFCEKSIKHKMAETAKYFLFSANRGHTISSCLCNVSQCTNKHSVQNNHFIK